MTQRDWQKDMEMCTEVSPMVAKDEFIRMSVYWLQEAKERGEREQRMKELMKDALGSMVMLVGKDNEHVQRIVKVFRTLHPNDQSPASEKAEKDREQCLREAVTDLIGIFVDCGEWIYIEDRDGYQRPLDRFDTDKFIKIRDLLSSLYPDTPAPTPTKEDGHGA